MSLQVWLPLNSTAVNKGLGTVSKTGGTTNFDKASKIGGKALNLKQRSTYTCPQLANLKTFSIAFWAMVEASSSITGDWMDVMGFYDVSSSGSEGVFRWETCYSYAAGAGIHWHDNGINALTNSSYNHNAAKGEWVHCCVVFDAATAKIYSYSNGVLGLTCTHLGGHFNSSGSFYLGENNIIEGRIQDVRIYDHALSTKEVKEISKGLCLHYKLSDYGMPNLCSNSYNFSGWSYSGTLDNTNTYNGASSIQTSYCWQGVYINLKSYVDAGVIKKGDTLTYSIYVKAGADISQARFSYYRFSADADPSHPIVDLKKDVWQKFSYTFQVSDYSLTSTVARFEYDGPYDLTNTNQYQIKSGAHVYFALPKFEINDKATPWVPSVNDSIYKTLGFNSNVEVDCSGFGNDGSKIGTTAKSNGDTKRYTTCRETIDKTSYINAGQGAKITDEITISCWGYMTNWSNYSSMRLFSCTEGGGWNLEVMSSTNKFNFPVYVSGVGYINCNSTIDYASLSSGWHHFACTYNGLESKIYIDGKLNASKGNGQSTKIPIQYNSTNSIFIGAEATSSASTADTSQTFIGKISDFRIYATALSADDVAELYSTSAAIDNAGNGYAYELVEED